MIDFLFPYLAWFYSIKRCRCRMAKSSRKITFTWSKYWGFDPLKVIISFYVFLFSCSITWFLLIESLWSYHLVSKQSFLGVPLATDSFLEWPWLLVLVLYISLIVKPGLGIVCIIVGEDKECLGYKLSPIQVCSSSPKLQYKDILILVLRLALLYSWYWN